MREFQVLKSDITKTRIAEVDINQSVLEKDEILVQIENFSFTANNISYGFAGDSLNDVWHPEHETRQIYNRYAYRNYGARRNQISHKYQHWWS